MPALQFTKRTIRIETEANDKVETLSREHHVSVDSLLNKAVRWYVDWELFAERVGLIQISPGLWKLLMNKLSDAEAREIGRNSGGDASVEFIRSYFHRFDLATVLESFKILGEQFMHTFRYAEFGDDERRTVVLNHKAGIRVSAYYAEVFRALCKRLGIEVSVDESEDQIVATITNQARVKSGKGSIGKISFGPVG